MTLCFQVLAALLAFHLFGLRCGNSSVLTIPRELGFPCSLTLAVDKMMWLSTFQEPIPKHGEWGFPEKRTCAQSGILYFTYALVVQSKHPTIYHSMNSAD